MAGARCAPPPDLDRENCSEGWRTAGWFVQVICSAPSPGKLWVDLLTLVACITPKARIVISSREEGRPDHASSGRQWGFDLGDPACSGPTLDVEIDRLVVGPSPRMPRLSLPHAAVLAELHGHWPPILVRGRDMVVVDGHHRVEAARRIGLTSIRCELFDGSDADAYVESVRRNTEHGRALTLHERRAAAARILAAEGEWSDRRIATLCGLASDTVGRIRAETEVRGHVLDLGDRSSRRRVGQDGRRRSVDPGAARERILRRLEEDPAASLRAVARALGVSPSTVGAVRKRSRAVTAAPPAQEEPLGALERMETSGGGGPTQSYLPAGDFIQWFDGTEMGLEAADAHLRAVPLSRVYEIADQARRRARLWEAFADTVEPRSERLT
jgi:ParB-like chromosome segregation protein Spo0J